eukprot:3236792-Rhodomonas_salina.1
MLAIRAHLPGRKHTPNKETPENTDQTLREHLSFSQVSTKEGDGLPLEESQDGGKDGGEGVVLMHMRAAQDLEAALRLSANKASKPSLNVLSLEAGVALEPLRRRWA